MIRGPSLVAWASAFSDGPMQICLSFPACLLACPLAVSFSPIHPALSLRELGSTSRQTLHFPISEILTNPTSLHSPTRRLMARNWPMTNQHRITGYLDHAFIKLVLASQSSQCEDTQKDTVWHLTLSCQPSLTWPTSGPEMFQGRALSGHTVCKTPALTSQDKDRIAAWMEEEKKHNKNSPLGSLGEKGLKEGYTCIMFNVNW